MGPKSELLVNVPDRPRTLIFYFLSSPFALQDILRDNNVWIRPGSGPGTYPLAWPHKDQRGQGGRGRAAAAVRYCGSHGETAKSGLLLIQLRALYFNVQEQVGHGDDFHVFFVQRDNAVALTNVLNHN